MFAGFPDKVLTIEGKICPKEVLSVFQHLIECAQLMTTTYHDRNLLFLVVSATIWGVYSNRPYPTAPIRLGKDPPYANIDPIQNQMIKD